MTSITSTPAKTVTIAGAVYTITNWSGTDVLISKKGTGYMIEPGVSQPHSFPGGTPLRSKGNPVYVMNVGLPRPHRRRTQGAASMSENVHHTRATSRLHNGTTNEVARAQAEATLALAYEQRTANLIAMFTDGATGPVPDIEYGALIEQIRERLGL